MVCQTLKPEVKIKNGLPILNNSLGNSESRIPKTPDLSKYDLTLSLGFTKYVFTG